MAENANQVEHAINQTRERLGDALDSIASKTDLGGAADAVSANLRERANQLDLAGDSALHGFASVPPSPSKAPIAIVVGLAIVGLVAGFVVPLSEAERTRLAPIGGDLAKRAIDARDEIVSQSKAVVSETVGAAQASAQKHGQELATNLGVDVPDASA